MHNHHRLDLHHRDIRLALCGLIVGTAALLAACGGSTATAATEPSTAAAAAAEAAAQADVKVLMLGNSHTVGAGLPEQLVRTVRAGAAAPLLFPEWSRRGVEETQRIWALHSQIAGHAPACVAPVPQAWGLALRRDPALALHANDGNHANSAGAFLAALMLHSTLTGLSPLALPDLPGAVPVELQRRLRQVAADTALQQPPRALCPADAPQLQ